MTRPLLLATLLATLCACTDGTASNDAAAAPLTAADYASKLTPPADLAASTYWMRMPEPRPDRAAMEADPVWQIEWRIDAAGGTNTSLDEAERLLDKALAADPDNPDLRLQQARYAIITGDHGGDTFALQLLGEMLAKHPDYSEGYVLRGHVLSNLGRHREAYASLAKAAQLGSMSPWLNLNRATIANEMGKFQFAYEDCERVKERAPASSKVRASIAICQEPWLRRQRDWDAIDRAHREMRALRPDDVWLKVNHASFLCFDRGRCDEAQAIIDEARTHANMPVMDNIEAAIRYDAWGRAAAAHGIDSQAARDAFDVAQAYQDDLAFAMARYTPRPGSEGLVEALQAKGVSVDATGPRYAPALRVASMRGELDTVKMLLAHGADVNLNEQGHTALTYAAREGHLDVVQALVAAGADLTSNPNKALDLARENGHLEVVTFLEEAFPHFARD